jgi:hypothetical protein
MTKKEVVEAFKQAEIEWSNNLNDNEELPRNLGLCSYFRYWQKIHYCDVYKFLQPLWIKFSSNEPYLDAYAFNSQKERLEAIRNVIKDLENE